MRFRFNFQAIPVTLAAMGLWAVIGGWYIAIAPVNLAGMDNIGIVLSTFGACLFLADRLAAYWLKIECWLIFVKLWFLGLLFIVWGLLEWLGAFAKKYWLIFAVHWLCLVLVITAGWLLARRPKEDGKS